VRAGSTFVRCASREISSNKEITAAIGRTDETV